MSLLFTCLRPSDSKKQRSWIGPNNFIEGIMPTKRSGLGLVEIDEKIYIFGGNSNGEIQDFDQLFLAVLIQSTVVKPLPNTSIQEYYLGQC